MCTSVYCLYQYQMKIQAGLRYGSNWTFPVVGDTDWRAQARIRPAHGPGCRVLVLDHWLPWTHMYHQETDIMSGIINEIYIDAD